MNALTFECLYLPIRNLFTRLQLLKEEDYIKL